MRAIRTAGRLRLRITSIEVMVDRRNPYSPSPGLVWAGMWDSLGDGRRRWTTLFHAPVGLVPSALNTGCMHCGGHGPCSVCERGQRHDDMPF
jgi:hypothetical protein